MHNNQIILAAVAGLASTAAASVNFHAADALSHLSPAVVARQQPDLGDACLNDIMQILTTVPQPPQELAEWAENEVSDVDVTNPSALAELCSPATDMPSSLTSASAAYETSLVSWLGAESSALVSVISSCSDNEYVKSASSLVDIVTKDPACSSALAGASATLSGLLPAGTTAAASPTASGGASPTGGSAPQETTAVPAAAGHNGVVASVLVGAGFLGLVAML